MVCVEIEGLTDVSRGQLMSAMRAQGVDSRPYFYPISDMPVFHGADTPVAHQVSCCGLNLPSYYDLTEQDVGRVCDVFKASLNAMGR